MSYFKPGSLSHTLESLLDKHGLLDLLVTLELLCDDKADLVIQVLQDRKLASAWRAASKALERLSRSETVNRLP